MRDAQDNVIVKHKDLTHLNTFGLRSTADLYFGVHHFETLDFAFEEEPIILGGGSNVLLPERIRRPVIQFLGTQILVEDMFPDRIHLKVEAGVEWHQLVSYCVQHYLGGLENLALIPGSVGAAPVQNIGAYGVELEQRLLQVETFHLRTGESKTYSREACEFGYRDSRFKRSDEKNEVITAVHFGLTRSKHQLVTHYEALSRYLIEHKIDRPSIRQVYKAVIAIRQSKLPSPDEIGNCGSFFKNPIISRDQLEDVLRRDPQTKYYDVDDTKVKLAAGYLIDRSGWRGRNLGPVGSYEKQALVLVNRGGATQSDVVRLAEAIKDDVFERYGVRLEEEVQILEG